MFEALSSLFMPVADIAWGSVVTTSSFDGMIDGISTVLPIVVPVGLTVLGVGVVWRIVKKMAKG